MLASHEALAIALYDEFARLGRRVGPDVSVICIFPVIGARGLLPALSLLRRPTSTRSASRWPST